MITLTGRVPSKKNSKQIITVRGRAMLIPSLAHKKWHADASAQLKQFSQRETYGKKTFLFRVYAPDARASDLSNKWESVADLLVDNGFVKDDNWFEMPTVIMSFAGIDRENPRVEISCIDFTL